MAELDAKKKEFETSSTQTLEKLKESILANYKKLEEKTNQEERRLLDLRNKIEELTAQERDLEE